MQAQLSKTYNFPVELQQAYTPSGKGIPKKFAVVRTDTDEVMSVVTDRYQLIKHEEVLDQVRSLLEKLNGKTNKTDVQCFLGKNGATMNYVATFKNIGLDMKVGDHVGMRLLLRNSYTGGSATVIRIGGVVLSCTNGMVKNDPKTMSSLRLNHITSNKNKLNIPTADHLINSFMESAKVWDKYSQTHINSDMYHDIISEAGSRGAITSEFQKQMVGPGAIESNTAWDTMQRLTFHITHERPKLSEDNRITALANINNVFEARFS